MASEKDSEKKIVKPVNDGSSENAENQFGEASSVDKVTLNNKIICMRSTVKKSKVRILAKLIRHIKQLKQKINGKPVNVEKNKRKHTNLVEEMKVIKALKADTVSRFVLGNTFTFVELNNKGFQSTEARALARFSDEKLLQDIVKKFRAEHSDWKSLAAFVQTQSSGRHIKKKQKKKNKLEKEGTKTNIKAKQAMVSTFLDGKVNNINSVKEDSESESDIKNSHVTDTKSSPQKQKKTVSNKNKQPVCKNLQPIDSEPQVKEKKSNSDVSSGIGAQNSKKENQNSKQKHNSPDTNSTTNKLKNSEKELSDDKQTEIPPPQNVGMVVKKINLNNFDEDILINKTPKLEDSAEKLFGNVSNQNTECEFFFINGQESSRAKEEEEEEKKDEEVNQKNDNDSAEFTISGNHSMFLSLSDRDTPSFRGGRGMRGTRGIQGTRGRMNFHSDFKRPNFQRHQNSGRPNNFARGSFSNRGRGEKTSSYPPRKTFNESRDTTSKNTDKPKLSDKNNLSEEKLHPSWEASRKRKEQAASISAFQGKKIKFDD